MLFEHKLRHNYGTTCNYLFDIIEMIHLYLKFYRFFILSNHQLRLRARVYQSFVTALVALYLGRFGRVWATP